MIRENIIGAIFKEDSNRIGIKEKIKQNNMLKIIAEYCNFFLEGKDMIIILIFYSKRTREARFNIIW